MARSGSEERKASRRQQIGRGLALGTVALGVPALINAAIARRASRLPPAQLPAADTWRSDRFDGPRGRLHLRSRGHQHTTAPIVLIHSLGPGHSQQQWMTAAELLSASHPVLLIDLLGWGASERPDVDYGLESCVGDLEALAEDRLEQPFYLVASGESAPIALTLAETLPERIAGVALSGPAGIQLVDGEQSTRDRLVDTLLGAPIFGTSAVNTYTRRSAVESNLNRHQLAAPSQAQVAEHYRLAHLPGSARPIAAFLRGRYERSLESLSLHADLKLWIGWGRNAVGEPVEDADLWLRHLEQADLVVFEEAGSWPHVDVPGPFAKELLSFISSN